MTGPSNELATGQRIGPFEVDRVLGRGGMGVVYAAVHVTQGYVAAVKTSTAVDSGMMSKLRREAVTLGRLRHPGVVGVIASGIEGGHPWYAMELLPGATLSDLVSRYWRAEETLPELELRPVADDTHGIVSAPTLASEIPAARATAPHRAAIGRSPDDNPAPSEQTLTMGPLGTGDTAVEHVGEPRVPTREPPLGPRPLAAAGRLDEVLPLVRGLCEVLGFVHGEGIIHRDLKPANIFVRPGRLPVLVDFGLASEVVAATGREVIASVGGVAGSLAYMAPEQLRGELLDARADLYALGCILYELVTGVRPFVGRGVEIINGHLEQRPPDPSAWVKGIPTALEELILGLMVKNRDGRLGYAEDVDAVLARLGTPACAWAQSLPPHQPYLYRPPFVGRQVVLASIMRHIDALHEGQGALVFIGGASGSGKTRLALEASSAAQRAGISVVTGECIPSSNLGGPVREATGPLQPLAQLFELAADRCLEGGEAQVAQAVSQMFGSGAAVLAPYSSAVAQLPGVAEQPTPELLPAPATRTRLFSAVVRMLRGLTRTRPLLFLIDDLQWADGLTRGVLRHLRETLGEDPVAALMVVGSYRSDEDLGDLQAIVDADSVVSLSLGRMREFELGQMVSGMLAMAEPPAAFVSFLAHHSGGNPFFVAEYLRTAVAEQVLVRDRAGRWRLANSEVPTAAICEALPLPRSLRQMVELRLAKLSPSTRTVLEAASLIGRSFDSELLRDIVELDDGTMLRVYAELERHQVIEPAGSGRYRFAHDKLHELPAAQLDAGPRRALHAKIAATMGARYGDDAGHEHAAIGRHWAAAGEAARAVPHLRAAGDRATRFHAVGAAIGLFRAALVEVEHLDPASPAVRREAERLDERLGDALMLDSRHDDARAAFQKAITREEDTDLALGLRMMRKIGKAWEVEHRFEEALSAYGELAAAIEVARVPAVSVAPTHDHERGELEPPGVVLGREQIQHMLGRTWIYYWTGRLEEMDATIAALRPQIEAEGTALDRYRFFLAIVTHAYRRERYRVTPDVVAAAQACVTAAQEANAAGELAFARFVHGFGLLFAGRLDAAELEIHEGWQASRRFGDAVGETRAVAYLALIQRCLGRVEEARRLTPSVIAMSRKTKLGDYEGLGLSLQAWIAMRDGEPGRARALCRSARARWDELSFPFPFRWTATLIQLALELETEPPLALVELARELISETQHHLPEALDVLLTRAVAEYETDEIDAARATLTEAVALGRTLRYL